MVKTGAYLFDVRGLVFSTDGFRIIFYRRLPENFYAWLIKVGVQVEEVEINDDEILGIQYKYCFL